MLKLSELLGRSAALAALFRSLQMVVKLDHLAVLLTGETGTGKSLVARVLHENGARASGPFVAVNCAAIPKDLWEAEFFGSSRHAYTQAAERAGRFAAADGGTLFLDEIGELSLEQQAKLLRVLDAGWYERLGEDRSRQADVRVLAATNRPLEPAIREGVFRADLYYRLNRCRLHVPSLAERMEDIGELATVLAERECKLLRVAPLPVSEAAIRLLQAQAWPGNIRQLQSVVGRAVMEAAMSQSDRILPEHCVCAEPDAVAVLAAPSLPRSGAAESFAEATRCFQRELIAAALDREQGNVSRVAARLGLSRSHLYTLLDVLDLRPREVRARARSSRTRT